MKSFVTMADHSSFWQNIRSASAAGIRRPLLACFIVASGTVIGAGMVAIPSMIGGTPAMAAPSAAYTPDMDSLLDGRSPGSRRYGWLLDSKPGYGPTNPVERVLSSVRRRPIATGIPNLPFGAPIIPLAAIPDTGIPVDAVTDLGGPGSLVGPGGFGGGPVAGGILPGGGGGNGGNSGGGPGNGGEPDTPIFPVSPVPEPTTWIMVILGFALLGIAMRQRSAAFVTSQ